MWGPTLMVMLELWRRRASHLKHRLREAHQIRRCRVAIAQDIPTSAESGLGRVSVDALLNGAAAGAARSQVTTPYAGPRVHFTSPTDFVFAGSRAGVEPGMETTSPAWSCYSYSARQRAFTVVRVPHLHALREVPFVYEAQRTDGTHMVSVGEEVLLSLAFPPVATVLYLFSIARCGGTLLANLARAQGNVVLDEPDALTHLSLAAQRGTPADTTALAATVVSSFLSAPSPLVMVKARSTSSVRPDALMRPQDVGVFLWRSPEPWFISNNRAFSFSPAVAAGALGQFVRGRNRLRSAGRLTAEFWYEDIMVDPQPFLSLLPLFDDAARRAIDDVMSRDSQEGSGLSRSALNSRPSPSPFTVEEFLECWRAQPEYANLAEVGLERLLV